MKTLKDIARITGFSVKTVSRALNNHPDIALKTKKNILECANEINYKPNIVARSLRQKKSYAIGLILPNIINEFFGIIALAIEEYFKNLNYSLLISFSNDEYQQEIKLIETLIYRQIDGIILAPSVTPIDDTTNYIKNFINNLNIPLVLINEKLKGMRINVVLYDNVRGAYILTKHLIEHGHKKIGCITGPLSNIAGKRRLEGFKKALMDSKINPQDEFIKIANWDMESGYNSTIELLENKQNRPSAIFVANTTVVLGALNAINKLRLRIPDDIAIVTFHDLSFTSVTDPPLTTLRRCEDKIGKIAADILFKKMKNIDNDFSEEILVESELLIRESCGCK